ncbi:MAG: OmpA family protein [Macellibacteroides fermentans]|uniref:OmpA family protein n=1 Tax=Macellibacteroides fermentans TaxID=879969 RepID=UPI003AD658AB
MKKFILFSGFTFMLYCSAEAQSWIDRVGKSAENAAKRAVENRVERKTDETVNKTMDKVEESEKKKGKKSDSKNQGEQQIREPSLASYSKFDFVPGEKVIFFDDFSSESIGDFPLKWFTNGSGEVVTTNRGAGNFFKITKTGYYIPELHEKFTDNFTVEFDLIPLNSSMKTMYGIDFFVLSGDTNSPGYGSQPGKAGIRIRPDYETVMWNNWSEAREWQGENGDVAATFKPDQKYRVSFWVQKQRIRMYVNEQKILDLPRGLQANYTYNIFRIETFTDDATPYIGNFRIAAGAPDVRNKLMKEGKLVSYGIYFDVNKDVVKPESYGTLKEIAAVLNEVPSVKVKITGHTDSDGNDAANLDLSKRRAASVKAELVKSFGVNGDRLTTDGAGESRPVALNDSPANKALNRRVEFVKQ